MSDTLYFTEIFHERDDHWQAESTDENVEYTRNIAER